MSVDVTVKREDCQTQKKNNHGVEIIDLKINR